MTSKAELEQMKAGYQEWSHETYEGAKGFASAVREAGNKYSVNGPSLKAGRWIVGVWKKDKR